MEKEFIYTENSYFGASNSYSGFISYFDRIFKRDEFLRVFIIKGGPGTGKSSFMKKVLSEFYGKLNTEAIYCSSDPSSLDGIILSNENGKIAFIDGTAPHAEETAYPGAKDEIIDLGQCWDRAWLSGSYDKIKALSKEKKEAYNTAYSYLKIAGHCHEIIEKMTVKVYKRNESRQKAMSFAEQISTKRDGKKDVRLISAFCKSGKYSLKTLEKKGVVRYSIEGEGLTTYLFLEDIICALDFIGANYRRYPSPFSEKLTEAVYLSDEDILISQSEIGEVIDCGEFLSEGQSVLSEQAKTTEIIRNDALREAQRWLGIASDFHFRLEEIYSPSMDFNKCDVIFSEKLALCKNLLGL